MNTTEKYSNPPEKTQCYYGWSNDGIIRKMSSSGGIFYSFAKHAIIHGGIAVGAAFDKNGQLHTEIVDNLEGLDAILGSKYVQCRTGTIYQQVKDICHQGKPVVFCATPCQCNALLRYLGKNKRDNLLVIDFICHGVPSEGVWEKYLAHVAKGKQVTGISFRDKRIGWGKYGIYLKFADGQDYFKEHLEDSFYKLFLGNRILRPSCHRCRAKGKQHFSDITLGDYWGGNHQENSSDGVSLILIHTANGLEWLGKVADSLTTNNIPFEQAVSNNLNYSQSCGIPFNRNKVFEAISSNATDVFDNPERYTKTSLVEKVIRKCIRIIRNHFPPDEQCYLDMILKSDTKESSDTKAACCGCGACENICPQKAISMKKDAEGFLYPVIDFKQCCNCNLCRKVCNR